MKKLYLALVLTFLLVSSAFAGQRYIKFDAQTGGWTATNTVTGATSGATAVIKGIQDDGTAGVLELTQVVGTFIDNEIIYESALGGELLTNGTMEADANWDTYGAATTNERSIEQVHGGTYSRKLIAPIAGGGCSQYVADLLTTGEFGQISGWIYIGTLNANAISLVVSKYGGGLFLELKSDTIGSWVYVSGVFLMDGSADWGGVINAVSATTGTSTWYVDDVSIKEITNAALVNGSPFGGARAIW